MLTPPSCPHCGDDPDEPDNHRDGCPTVDTCAQTEPNIPRPLHPDAEWLAGEPFTSERLDAHLRDAHGWRR